MAFAGCTGSVPIPQKMLVGSFYSFPQKSHTKYKECFVACQRMIRKSIGRFMTTEVILMEKNNKKTKDQLKGEKWKKVLWKLGLQLKFKNFQSFQITCSVLCQAPRYLDANWLCLLKPDYFTVNLIQKELIGVIPIFERITHPPKVITQSNQISLPPQALPADVAVAAVPCTVGTNAGWRSKRSLERLGILKRNKETQYALYSWVTHKFTLISVSSSPGPAKNNKKINFLLKYFLSSDTNNPINITRKQKVILEKYLKLRAARPAQHSGLLQKTKSLSPICCGRWYCKEVNSCSGIHTFSW